MKEKEEIREAIQKRYAQIAINNSEGGGCCDGGCSCNSSQTDVNKASLIMGYLKEDLSSVPSDSNMGLGCGNPTALAALREGETVLDLGSGGGFDCFLARRQIGETGYVIGVDMTPEMLRLARQNAKISGYTNIDFRLGEIEHLPVADLSVDVIISNCVINLSPDKEQVYKEAYRVLKPGGRLSISDIVATAELPEEIKQDLTLMAGCVAGAEYVENIRAMMESVGFKNIILKPKDNSKVILESWVEDGNVEDFVASYYIEAIK